MFVVGDVHGHRDVLAGLLRDSGLVDAAERWRGGDARLWLLGDLVDRGPDGIGAIDLVRRLERESAGAVRCLLGNHEVLLLAVHRFAAEETVVPGQSYHDLWKLNGGRRRRPRRADARSTCIGSPRCRRRSAGGRLAARPRRHARPTSSSGSSLDEVARVASAALSVGSVEDVDDLLADRRRPDAPRRRWPRSKRCSARSAARGSSTATRPSRRSGASIRVRSPRRWSTGTAA